MPGLRRVVREHPHPRTRRSWRGRWQRRPSALGLDRFNLWGTSFGGKTALDLAAQAPELLSALVLESPAAIRPTGGRPPSGTPEEIARALFAHPERVPPLPPQTRRSSRKPGGSSPGCAAPSATPILRPDSRPRDADAGAVRNARPVTPPELGRRYKAALPNCNLVLVYDSAHAIGTDRPEAFCEIVGRFSRTPRGVHHQPRRDADKPVVVLVIARSHGRRSNLLPHRMIGRRLLSHARSDGDGRSGYVGSSSSLVSRPISIAITLEDCEAAHERGHIVKAAAERADQQPGHQRAEAGDDPPGAIAERDAGRADMGREEFGEIDRVAREHPENEEAEDRQHHRIPRLIGRQRQIQDQPEDDRADAVDAIVGRRPTQSAMKPKAA